MANFSISTTTNRSPEDVFSYLADMSHASEWDPGVLQARRLDEGPLAVGSAFELRLQAFGQRFTLTYTIAELEPPTKVVLSSENSFVVSRDTITVAANEEGTTTVAYSAELEGKGLAAVAEPLWRFIINSLGQQAAEGFLAQFAP